MTALYKKGDTVKFNLSNFTKSTSSLIAAVTQIEKPIQQYIVEFTNGFKPKVEMVTDYGLDANKRYLFLNEKQITLAP